jgi:hypothetical protein
LYLPVFAALLCMQPRLKRQRPLARACPQLLLDLAALLSGLRPLVMLDHAAGITPAQLMQVLQPLPQLLPLFQSEMMVEDDDPQLGVNLDALQQMVFCMQQGVRQMIVMCCC